MLRGPCMSPRLPWAILIISRRAPSTMGPSPAGPRFMASPEYTAAYNEVLAYGGNGTTTPTQRYRRANRHRHLLGLRRPSRPGHAAAAV